MPTRGDGVSGPAAPPGGDRGLRAALLRAGGTAVVVVVAVAAAFGLVGALTGDDDPAPEIAGDAESQDDAADPAAETADEEEPDPEASDDAEGDPGTEDATGDADASDADEPDPDGEGEDASDEEAAEEGPDDEPEAPADEPESAEEEPADTEDDDEPARLDPSSISVQVLDGVHTDGGAAADAVAGEVSDAGYRMVAQNQSISYDQTTVLWTSGSEQAARQLARDLGISQVRAQPGNLSEGVDAHVVVGADRS